MTGDPTFCIAQGLPTQLEPMNAALDPSLDKASLFEDLQMLRDRGLGGGELTAELAGASRPAPRERANHRSARTVGEGPEGKIQSCGLLHSHSTIYQCRRTKAMP